MTSDIAYAPFGEPYASSATSGVSFTGMRSDLIAASGGVTNGLYDFLERELPPTQGRWLSPDRAGLAAVDPTNPQSWNRYAYVLNNPLSLIDPHGSDCTYYNDDETGIESTDTNSNEGECLNNGGSWSDNNPMPPSQYGADQGAPPANPLGSGAGTATDNMGNVVLKSCNGTPSIQTCGTQFGDDLAIPKWYTDEANLLETLINTPTLLLINGTTVNLPGVTEDKLGWPAIYEEFGITNLTGPPLPNYFSKTPCFGALKKVSPSMAAQMSAMCSGL